MWFSTKDADNSFFIKCGFGFYEDENYDNDEFVDEGTAVDVLCGVVDQEQKLWTSGVSLLSLEASASHKLGWDSR